jgi:Domain of unknown function (DUF222)
LAAFEEALDVDLGRRETYGPAPSVERELVWRARSTPGIIERMFDVCVDDGPPAFELSDAEWAELDTVTPAGDRPATDPWEVYPPGVDGVAVPRQTSGPVPGPAPAGQASQVDNPKLLLDMAVEAGREAGRAQAAGLRALGRFAVLHPPAPDDQGPGFNGGPLVDGGPLFDEFAGDEVAIALSLSPGAGYGQLELGYVLCRRLPATLAALGAGVIDLGRARGMAEGTACLTAADAAVVEVRVLAGGGRASHSHFRRAIRRAVLRADPSGAKRRHRAARTGRRVELSAAEDGMGSLWALLPAEDAVAGYDRLSLLARKLGGDDPRGMDARRADILTDLILGRGSYLTPVSVNVTVAASALAGVDDEPGELAGYGPIPADTARRLAEHATWRRILHDDTSGAVLDVGRRRFPSPQLARHVRARNAQCTFPGCPQPSQRSDIDHTRPHARGGVTTDGNLGPACRRHNRMKERDGWTVLQPTPGTFTWTGPTGHTATTTPTSYQPPPRPDPPPPPDPVTHDDLGPPPF